MYLQLLILYLHYEFIDICILHNKQILFLTRSGFREKESKIRSVHSAAPEEIGRVPEEGSRT